MLKVSSFLRDDGGISNSYFSLLHSFLLTAENRKYWSIWFVPQFPFVILIFQFPANFVLRKSNKKSYKSIEQTFYIEFSLQVCQ